MVCCCTSPNHLFFHLYHSPSGCPSDPPLWVCFCECAAHVKLAHSPSAIIHFFYFWSTVGGEVGTRYVYQYHWSVFPLWHINIPSMTADLPPHRSADFLCSCLVLRAGEQTVHADTVSSPTRLSLRFLTQCWIPWTGSDTSVLPHNDEIFFLVILESNVGSLIQCHMCEAPTQFSKFTRTVFLLVLQAYCSSTCRNPHFCWHMIWLFYYRPFYSIIKNVCVHFVSGKCMIPHSFRQVSKF